jgi:hypothetical protein
MMKVANRFVRISLASLVLSALGVAVFAQVRNDGRLVETIVVKNPGKSDRLDTRLLSGVRPSTPRPLTDVQVKKIASDLKVHPSATVWQNVTLDARHPFYPKARLDVMGGKYYYTGDNFILVESRVATASAIQVTFNAMKAGDTYLVTYYVYPTKDGTELRVFSSGDTPDAALTLSAGQHQIPVAVIPTSAGNQHVTLTLWNEGRVVYLQRVDVQLLNP